MQCWIKETVAVQAIFFWGLVMIYGKNTFWNIVSMTIFD